MQGYARYEPRGRRRLKRILLKMQVYEGGGRRN